MSALTKVFIVLLVVLSMLTTSAFIVYVNREQNWKTAAEVQTAKLEAENRTAKEAANQAAALMQLTQNNIATVESQRSSLAGSLATAETKIREQGLQLAKISSDYAGLTSQVATLSEALKASQDTQTRQQDIVKELRESNEKLVSNNVDQGKYINGLVSTLDVTNRQRENALEQLQAAQERNQDLSGALKDLSGTGIAVDEALNRPGTGYGAPDVKGVVRDVQEIAGVKYATISVGSADGVTKDMQFQVIDRQKGDFLGVLTVDTVEPNEAIGRLQGPAIERIKPGVEARTQL